MILGRIVLSFSSLIVFLLIASIYAVFFYQNPPIVILNDPVPTDKQQYKPGDRVVIAVEAEIKSQSPSTLLISWKGETLQPFPITEIKASGLPLGRVERTFPIAVVPQVLPPGRYVLEVVSVYNLTVFPIERKVEWRSTEFEVVREGSTSTVPITAYLFLTDSSGESPSDLASEMPRLEATATVPVIPESTAVPLSPVFPKPTVAIPSPTEAPNIPGSAPASTATPEPTPIIVPTPVDIPPIPPPHPLPPVDPPPIFIPPLPPIDVPPIELPPVPIPPVPGRN